MERSYCGARAWCWDRDQGTVNFINHERTILCHVISGGILIMFLLICISVYRIVLCVC